MGRVVRGAIALVALLAGGATQQPSLSDVLAAVRAADLRLASVGERLAIANAALCTDRVGRAGLVIHDLSQYAVSARPEARRMFGFAAPIAVEAVVAGGAADRAGVRADDSILRVDDALLEAGPIDTGRAANTDRVDAASSRIASAGADGRLVLDLLRAGAPLRIVVAPPAGCASRFELEIDDTRNAVADGRIVQLTSGIMEQARDDDELAVLVAHELAHNVLRHKVRLQAAGVKRGLLEGISSDVGYIRRTELEADLLGITLVANAGYDTGAAARFWARFGRANLNSIFLARTHPRWTTRVKLFERESARLSTLSVRPYVPTILAERDRPVTRDWESLVTGL